MRTVFESPAGNLPGGSFVVPAGAMTALGGKPQTTRKARALHAPYAPRGSKPITPSPERGRGKRAGDPARGYWEGSPKPPSPKGNPRPFKGREEVRAVFNDTLN